jgi:hypothetical protein
MEYCLWGGGPPASWGPVQWHRLPPPRVGPEYLSLPTKTARPQAESWGRDVENSSTWSSPCHNVMVMKTCCSRDVGRDIVINEVGRLQVEEVLTDVAPNVRLVIVIAEPLTAPLLLFGRRETMELASRAVGFC